VSDDWTELSKAVSHALRHEPWLYELELDDAGWTPVDALVNALSQEPRWRGPSSWVWFQFILVSARISPARYSGLDSVSTRRNGSGDGMYMPG
jgi:hypothetical protein